MDNRDEVKAFLSSRRAKITPERARQGLDPGPRRAQTVAAWQSMNGLQDGDPAKLADAFIRVAGLNEPPLRFTAGADAVATFEKKANDLLAQAEAHRELSSSLAHDDT